jgi:poly(3-hydroxyalkanoate) synthetase
LLEAHGTGVQAQVLGSTKWILSRGSKRGSWLFLWSAWQARSATAMQQPEISAPVKQPMAQNQHRDVISPLFHMAC